VTGAAKIGFSIADMELAGFEVTPEAITPTKKVA
jgi:hypothetical protein